MTVVWLKIGDKGYLGLNMDESFDELTKAYIEDREKFLDNVIIGNTGIEDGSELASAITVTGIS